MMSSKKAFKRIARKRTLRSTASRQLTHLPMSASRHGYGTGIDRKLSHKGYRETS